MSEAKGQHEPSMEEILASIRRIIAEDGEAPAEAPAAPEPPAAPRQEEILELTDVVDEEGSVVAPSAAPTPAPKAPPRAEPEPPPPPPPPPAPPRAAEADDRLVSGGAAAASVAALSQLATAGAPPRERPSDMPLGAVNRTLEDLVRELLRPLLKEWLDANLPPLVERVVQEEIRRMAREAFGR